MVHFVGTALNCYRCDDYNSNTGSLNCSDPFHYHNPGVVIHTCPLGVNLCYKFTATYLGKCALLVSYERHESVLFTKHNCIWDLNQTFGLKQYVFRFITCGRVQEWFTDFVTLHNGVHYNIASKTLMACDKQNLIFVPLYY